MQPLRMVSFRCFLCSIAVLSRVIEREWIPGTYEHVIVHAMRARLTYEMKWLTMQYQDGDNDEI